MQEVMRGRVIGRMIRRYQEVTSTNDLARRLGERGAAEGVVVTAEAQTAGRGRLGRAWLVPAGTSLQFSVLLRPPIAPAQAHRLTQMAALAVTATLRSELGLAARLKWPNDVLLNGKKCAGILIETALRGDALEFAILGIGLNVNYSMRDYPELARFATTLSDELDLAVDRLALENALLGTLDDYYWRLKSGEEFFGKWRRQLSTLGRIVRVEGPSGIQSGIAEDVGLDGALLLRRGDQLIRLYAGDVTLVKD